MDRSDKADGQSVRSYLEDGWRVLVLRPAEEGVELKEANLGLDGIVVETSPGVWNALFER